MKLLCYMSTPGGMTGAPRRLINLCSSIKKHGIEPIIATSIDTDLYKVSESCGIPVINFSPKGLLVLRQGGLFRRGIFFKLRVFKDLIRQNIHFLLVVRHSKSDAIWLRGSKDIAFSVLGALFSRKPLIWDVDYELPSSGVVRWLHRAGLWASSIVVFQYACAPDSIFGKALADRYREKFVSLTPGIDVDNLIPYRTARLASDLQRSREFSIIQVGSICDRKNQLLIIEAINLIKERDGDKSFSIKFVGGYFDEEYAGRLHDILEDYDIKGRVEFLGWRDDVHRLMSEANLLVMPSKDEGVPNAVQEAMAIGLPVIVSDAGGMPEIVSHGETGWIVPLGDPEAWSKQIEACYSDPELLHSVSETASIYAADHFGTEHWAAQYAGLMKGLSAR